MSAWSIDESLRDELQAFWQSPVGVLHRPEFCMGQDRSTAESAMLAIGTLLGHPLHVIRRWSLIHEVSVRTDGEATRFGGVGENAFHTDIVNSYDPPDAVIFLCLRPDPLGGGTLKSADMSAVVNSLSSTSRERLHEARVYEGRFFDLDGVGGERNPFPLFEQSNPPRYRFAVRAKLDTRNEAWLELLGEIEAALEKRASRYRLNAGDLLVINQRFVVHARDALGLGQELLDPSQRRLWLRLFVRRSDLLDCRRHIERS